MSYFTLDEERQIEEALSWYDPFNVFYFVRSPSVEGAAKTALLPSLYLASGIAVTHVLSPGGLAYSPVINTLHRVDQLGKTVKYGARVGGLAARGLLSPVFGALALAVSGAWAYELYVNNPLRDAHSGDIDWFGPFASGFGTVV